MNETLAHWRATDRKMAESMLAGDTRATHAVGEWLPVGAGLALVAVLFVRWYSLSIGTGGAPTQVDLASTAPQWMPVTAWLIASAGLIVAGLSAWRARLGSFRGVSDRMVNRVQVGVTGLAALAILIRLIDPPALPGSSGQYHLDGTSSVGPLLGLLVAVLMLLGLWVQRAELITAESDPAG